MDPNLQDVGKQLGEVVKTTGDLTTAINIIWTLVAGFLVMFMQAGLRAGRDRPHPRQERRPHDGHELPGLLPSACSASGRCGFALQMGGVGAHRRRSAATRTLHQRVHRRHRGQGTFGPVRHDRASSCRRAVYTPAVAALFLFQMVFMDTTATIPTGAWPSAGSSRRFVLFSFFIGALIYPVYANWVWGGGWLSQLGKNFGLGHGHVDFAGSSVVHLTGRRRWRSSAPSCSGRASASTTPGRHAQRHPRRTTSRWSCSAPSSSPSAGSASTPARTLAGDRRPHRRRRGQHDARLGSRRVRAHALHVARRTASPTRRMMCNGMLAGLVAITAPCAFVSAPVGASSSAPSPACWSCWRRSSSSERSRSTIRSAPSRSTASTAPGASSRSACSPTAPTATAGTASTAPCKGLFYGDAGQFVAAVHRHRRQCVLRRRDERYWSLFGHRQARRQSGPREDEIDGPRRARDGRGGLCGHGGRPCRGRSEKRAGRSIRHGPLFSALTVGVSGTRVNAAVVFGNVVISAGSAS